MSNLEIGLVCLSGFLVILYVISKIGKDKNFSEIIKEVKEDLNAAINTTADLVLKAKGIVFDESVKSAIKEFVMIVEEKSRIKKCSGEQVTGTAKKDEVLRKILEWTTNVTGSAVEGNKFMEENKAKIEGIIDDYVDFSNKMQGKEKRVMMKPMRFDE